MMQLEISLLLMAMEDCIQPNIRMDLTEMAQDRMDSISLAQDKAGSQHGNKPSVSI
jgi:hypothetical protein